ESTPTVPRSSLLAFAPLHCIQSRRELPVERLAQSVGRPLSGFHGHRLVQHPGEHLLAGPGIGRLLLDRRPHFLEQLLEEDALELVRRGPELLVGRVEHRRGCGRNPDVAHRTRTSARIAPAARRASKIAATSPAFAPAACSPCTRSCTLAPTVALIV